MPHARGTKRGTRHRTQRRRDFQRANRLLKTIGKFWDIAFAWAVNFAKNPIYYFTDTSALSPLAPVHFWDSKRKYRSVEHAFQAAQARCYKENREARLWECGTGYHFAYGQKRSVADPKQIRAWSDLLFRKFRQPSNPLGQAWRRGEKGKMFHFCLQKFRTNTVARQALLNTGHAYLLYKSNDAPWGAGAAIPAYEQQEGPVANHYAWGENRLGLMLMSIRNLLRRRLHRNQHLTYKKKVRAAIRYRRSVKFAPAVDMLIHFPHLNPLLWKPQMARMKRLRQENALRDLLPPIKYRRKH